MLGVEGGDREVVRLRIGSGNRLRREGRRGKAVIGHDHVRSLVEVKRADNVRDRLTCGDLKRRCSRLCGAVYFQPFGVPVPYWGGSARGRFGLFNARFAIWPGKTG